MATFPANINQTAQLGSLDGRDERAPPIGVGDNVDDQSKLAINEEVNRKRLRDLDPNAVTEDEVKQSRIRRIAVETTEAQVTHGLGNAAILQAIAATNATVQNIRRREKNRAGTWTPILVERSGNNQIGVAPANFPPSRGSVLSLSGNQITALQVAYNLPVGYFGNGALATRRNAVLDYFLDG